MPILCYCFIIARSRHISITTNAPKWNCPKILQTIHFQTLYDTIFWNVHHITRDGTIGEHLTIWGVSLLCNVQFIIIYLGDHPTWEVAPTGPINFYLHYILVIWSNVAQIGPVDTILQRMQESSQEGAIMDVTVVHYVITDNNIDG